MLAYAIPSLALAANPGSGAQRQRHCEAEARNAYKRRTTEVEMALIAGSLNDVEVSRARDGLTERLRLDQEDCARNAILRSSRPRLAKVQRASRKY